MNLKDYLKIIQQKGMRAFTANQVMLDLGLSKNAALNAIARQKKQGGLISPARGFYVIVPPEQQLYGSIPAQELVPLLMSHLKLDYYVGLLSAATFYGAMHQRPTKFQVVTHKQVIHPNRYTLKVGNLEIEFIYKKCLIGLPIQEKILPTGYLRIAKPELIAFDLLHYPARSGGLNHIATLISELSEALQKPKNTCRDFISFAEKTKETAWLQRLGFILDNLEQDSAIERLTNSLEHYLRKKSLQYIPLAPHLPHQGCERYKKWRIIANTAIESDL